MSLVDYASSDEDEAEVREEEKDTSEVTKDEPEVPNDDARAPLFRRPGPTPSQQLRNSHSSETPIIRLPDASVLLNSPAMSSDLASGRDHDHSSLVAAAMAESASRKRDANGLASTFTHSKVPRGALPHSRSIPDTATGLLVPPQLSGKSNVVTEDISKLFVKKVQNNHLNGSPN